MQSNSLKLMLFGLLGLAGILIVITIGILGAALNETQKSRTVLVTYPSSTTTMTVSSRSTSRLTTTQMPGTTTTSTTTLSMQSTSTTITGAATETASATTTLIEPSAFVINFVDRSVQWDAQYSNETAGAYMDLSEDYKRNLTAAFDANEERNVTISGIQFTEATSSRSVRAPSVTAVLFTATFARVVNDTEAEENFIKNDVINKTFVERTNHDVDPQSINVTSVTTTTPTVILSTFIPTTSTSSTSIPTSATSESTSSTSIPTSTTDTSTSSTSIPTTTESTSANPILTSTPSACGPVARPDQAFRIDCHPEPVPNQTECEIRHCAWDPNPNMSIAAPQCFKRIENCTGYGYNLYIDSGTGSENEKILYKHPITPTFYSNPIQFLKFFYENISGDVLHFKFTDANSSRFEVTDLLELWPDTGRPPLTTNMLSLSTLAAGSGTFAFRIARNFQNGTVLWDTTIGGLIFEDQFIQIATQLPSENVYGFGENVHQTLKHDFGKYKTWSLFSRDELPDSTTESFKNLYGVHPFYMCIEPDGKAHGVLLLNSNAMEYSTIPGPALVYRTIGGILDFYVFAGPTPGDVIRQYWSLIGYPMMPPYWAFGYQLSRFGYNSSQDIRDTIKRNFDAGVPTDIQVIDVEYMNRFQEFTYGGSFSDLPDLVNEIQQMGRKVWAIINPSISVNYSVFYDGIAVGAFVQWGPETNQTYIDQWNSLYAQTNGTRLLLAPVLPDPHSVFPDWLNPDGAKFWSDHIVEFHKNVNFDAIWVDMNEPTAFKTDMKNPDYPFPFIENKPNISVLLCPAESQYNNPPYKTHAVWQYLSPANPDATLCSNTICMSAAQNKGTYRHYDVHNLYPWSEAKPTFEAAIQATGKRPAVLSRANDCVYSGLRKQVDKIAKTACAF